MRAKIEYTFNFEVSLFKQKAAPPIPDYAYTLAERMKSQERGEDEISRALIQRGLEPELVPYVLKNVAERKKTQKREFRGAIQRQRADVFLKYSLMMIGLGALIAYLSPSGNGLGIGCALSAVAFGLMGLMGALTRYLASWI